MNHQIAIIGYGLAGSAYTILVLQMIFVQRSRAGVFHIALLVSAAWGFLLAYSGTQAGPSSFSILSLELVHDLAWLVFLGSVLGETILVRSGSLVRQGGVLLVAGMLIAGTGISFIGPESQVTAVHGYMLVLGSIAGSLFALIGIEQIYRNARSQQKSRIKHLCIGLGAIFAFDMVLYTEAVIAGEIGSLLWGVRGYIVALCVPLLAISAKHVPTLNRGIFLSREVVFYSTTMVLAGIYLLLIGFAGYYIQQLDQDWGSTLQIVFLVAAVLIFIILTLSNQIRGKARVFITKHFFERKFDYRTEWLRLIQTLTADGSGMPLKKRAIKSLADILHSPSGHLWLSDRSGDCYRSVSSWNLKPGNGVIQADDDLCEFLLDRGWILDIGEIRDGSLEYEPLSIDTLQEEIANMRYVIPLLHEDGMLGIVTLSQPLTPVPLSYEDFDLLKTAGQQIASYLAQEEATEQLAEGRQFEAYNRLTAYVMHDLKNAIAQQSLVVANAEKHKRNPDFIDDAIMTISESVKRMNRVMQQLKQNSFDQPVEKVDVVKLISQAVSQCSDRKPVPVSSVPNQSVVVVANPDRLLAALCHAIRNAQDATSHDGEIRIDLGCDAEQCEIRIRDTGEGMDEQFVNDRLFRPFDSTKGSEGMGIGAYQLRETVRSVRGDLLVDSQPGMGTTISVTLPLAE